MQCMEALKRGAQPPRKNWERRYLSRSYSAWMFAALTT